MSVLVYTESEKGAFKKAALEVASYARAVANQLETTVTAVAINVNDTSALGKYGVDKVLNVSDSKLDAFNAKSYADVLKQAAEKENAQVVILSSSADSKYLAPLLAVGLNAGFASNVIEAPESIAPFTVKRTAFTNKAFSSTTIDSDVKLIAVSNNAFGIVESAGNASAEAFSPSIPDPGVMVKSVDKATDKVTIADAETVVSAGRGLKLTRKLGND